MDKAIKPEILATPVTGRNLGTAGSLADALGSEPTLLVFLRHLG